MNPRPKGSPRMKFVAVLLAVILPRLALAACTYSGADGASTVVATCTTGTESAPTLATEGLKLQNLTGIVAFASAASAMTAGGQLQAYVYNLASGSWVRAPDLDLTVQALTGQAWPGFVVTVPTGRIDYRPSGTGQATTIVLQGASR